MSLLSQFYPAGSGNFSTGNGSAAAPFTGFGGAAHSFNSNSQHASANAIASVITYNLDYTITTAYSPLSLSLGFPSTTIVNGNIECDNNVSTNASELMIGGHWYGNVQMKTTQEGLVTMYIYDIQSFEGAVFLNPKSATTNAETGIVLQVDASVAANANKDALAALISSCLENMNVSKGTATRNWKKLIISTQGVLSLTDLSSLAQTNYAAADYTTKSFS